MNIAATLEAIGIGIKIISEVKSIADTVLPYLQEGMKNFAERLFELSEKYPSIKDFAQMMDKASEIMGDILFALGINSDFEHAGIVGAKASKCEKSVDDFSSVEDYFNHLKDEIKFDKDEFDALKPEEKIAHTITGLAIETGVISEKIGIEIPAEFVELISKISEIKGLIIEANKLISIINKSKDNGINNLNDIVDLVNGSGKSDRVKTGEALHKAIDEVYPNKADDIINDVIDNVRK